MQDEKNPKENKDQKGVTSTSYMLYVIAGGYLVYTGYQLCENLIKGLDVQLGFVAAGIAFIIIGAALVVLGIRGYSRDEKRKREEALEATDVSEESEEKEADQE